MGLKACPVIGKQKSVMLCEAFIQGAKASMSTQSWLEFRGFVFYGVKENNQASWHNALILAAERNVPFYVIDNSYFDRTRGTHFRVTRCALQHKGDGATDGKRFAAIGTPIRPWRDWDMPGEVLVVQQSEDHLVRMCGEPNWLPTRIAQTAEKHIGPVVIRAWSANKPKLMESFTEALARARLVLTHSSAAAVEAILYGVPVACSVKCAAFGMTYESDEERLRWAGVLADNQFTLEELKDGTAWRKLHS